MEEVRKVKSTVVDQKCPLCQKGYMRPTGIVAASNIEHKCTNCNYKQSYPVRYPYIVG